jgi:hypothetical protein
MDYVKLRLFRYDNYVSYNDYEASDKGLWRLATFLTRDVGIIKDAKNTWFYKWIFDKAATTSGGNTCTLSKSDEHEGEIIIGDGIEFDNPDEIIFVTTAEELAAILDRWAELCKQMPPEIIIKREQGKITLESVQ